MCGIAGVLRQDGRDADPGVVTAMREALVHRGPDSAGLMHDGPVSLGSRRLAVIDLAGGEQPVGSEDGRVVVVHNGELYNHAALRAELERADHRFASRCDTEVLVHGYEEHGTRLFERLRGMWAAAIWDGGARRLVLAVDPFAIKPLYVHANGRRVAFASELGALRRCPGVPSDLDPDALEAFLAFNAIPPPLTILRGVRKLGPGELLVAEPGGSVVMRRWGRPRPAVVGELTGTPRAALAAELRECLRRSVRAHLVADVPVGVFLSGGIDSGALAALAAEEVPQLSTFSVGFDEGSFDERDRARLVACRYATDHHEVELRAPDAAALLPEVAAAFDEPFADSSMLPTWLVSRLARSKVTVALSGEGGDELFGGYKTYAAAALAARIGPVAALAAPLA
ncbi:MAG: asparagine synthase (glutamine-hydrolyzing), partial [Actinomycetota bacterium]|nr:asparagine synthase (glutamine-hydrolyzing) [Actinomycetota bacterium]